MSSHSHKGSIVEDQLIKLIKLIMRAISMVFVLCLIMVGSVFYLANYYHPLKSGLNEVNEIVTAIDLNDVKEGIHLSTGLIVDVDLELVIANCTGCHSAKLIAQNKATKEGWKNTITWMQETQNLWDLGANEEKIIAYLAKNYAPEVQGRRKPLENVEWYELK